MTDLVDDFLNQAQEKLSDVEKLFPALEKNPADENVWNGLDDFFDYVRAVAPFAGFVRAYRLSDAALTAVRGYLDQKSGLTALPDILMKFQRVKKILSAAGRLKREPRESDADLLPAVEPPPQIAISAASAVSAVAPDLTAQEAALDEREEQLVVWAQALSEQDAALKQKENVLFEEERRQSEAQEKIAAVMNRLGEQEKLQADLEDHLAETRVALQGCQEKLADQERQQKQALDLLETKNEALSEMGRKIQELNALLGEKENLSEQREAQLYQELQQNRARAEELKIHLKTLEDFRDEISTDKQRMSSQYEKLEREYQDALTRLNVEKENTEVMLGEKRDLERQHIEFNTRFVALQESLNAERENVKRAQKALEQQKKRGDFLCAELKAAAWPYNAEKIQKDLAALALAGAMSKPARAGLAALRELAGNIRMRPFVRIPLFLQKIVQKAEKKYRRQCRLQIDAAVDANLDKDALTVLEKTLEALTDNAFRFARPDGDEVLTLTFTAAQEGAFMHFSFADNGRIFDFDRLRDAATAAGIVDPAIPVLPDRMPLCLFHNAVCFSGQDGERGLAVVARMLEKAGGRIDAVFDGGLNVRFSVPKKYLFDRVLVFGLDGRRFALPLNAVSETVFLRESEFSIKPQSDGEAASFYWKGLTLPVLNFNPAAADAAGYGLVVQSGVFGALIPVQQIFDTEQLVAFSDKGAESGVPWLVPCVLLESGSEVEWIDLAGLWEQTRPPVPKRIVSVKDAVPVDRDEKTPVSYLVFRSEPAVFGAVRVDDVLRVEDFSFPPASLAHKKYFETRGERLPLKDSCPRDNYPYAQAVLIFNTFALAILDVADIIDIPPSDAAADCIVYRGRKVPVFDPENKG